MNTDGQFLVDDKIVKTDYILSAQLPRDLTRSRVNKMEDIRNQLADIPAVSMYLYNSFVVKESQVL